MKIIQLLFLSLLVSALPVIILPLLIGKITGTNMMLSMMMGTGFSNFWDKHSRKQFMAQLIGAFAASTVMCLILHYFGI
ncbi:MAG: hypothetical protein ABI480_00325 [Chitinophagaceae bacterium]